LIFSLILSKVKSVIDDIAPVKVRMKSGRQKAPLRNSTAVQNIKRQCRKAERMWWKTLVVHHKDSTDAFNMELGKARQTFFSNIINSNLNNTHTLFATLERLTTPPSEMLSDGKCSEFASFFSEKINNIRKVISTSLSFSGVRQIRPQPEKMVTMSVFEETEGIILEETVLHLKTSTCALEALPTSFFKSVLNSFRPSEADLLEEVSASLLSRSFPKLSENCNYLKKSNLDKTILSNYRPISNLPFVSKIIEKVVFNKKFFNQHS